MLLSFTLTKDAVSHDDGGMAWCSHRPSPVAQDVIDNALYLADVEQNGRTSLRRLYTIINSIEGDPDTWLSFAEQAYASRYEHVRRAGSKHKPK